MESRALPLESFLQYLGDELLLKTAENHEALVERVEVIRTLVHLALVKRERNPHLTLKEFLELLERLETYDEDIKLATFGTDRGIKVLTLHGSKGLEFDYVWIAHMDEDSFMARKYSGFTLPEVISAQIEKLDENAAKRELYVALTRAKRYATISYARHSYTGVEQELAHIIADMSAMFERQSASQTEAAILSHDPKIFVAPSVAPRPGLGRGNKKGTKLAELTKLVASEYHNRNISVSLLNNFFECPWKWYFRSLLQLPEVERESLLFGDKVHKAIDRILKFKKVILPAEKDVARVVQAWVDARLKQILDKRENELPVAFCDQRFPHLNFYGKIDLLEILDPRTVRVTDFKTGSPRPQREIEKRDGEGRLGNLARQLAMYTYLLAGTRKWGKVKVAESRLEFLEAKDPTMALYSHVVTPEEIELLLQDIRDYDALVKSGRWVERECHSNSYGRNSSCEYCKLAEIYK